MATYTVWTKYHPYSNMADGTIVASGLTRDQAENLVSNLEDIYEDYKVWAEED